MDSITPSHPARLVITSSAPRVQTVHVPNSFPNSPTIINGFPVTMAAPSTSSGAGPQYYILDTSAPSASASSSGTGRANYVKVVSAGSKGSSTVGGNVFTLAPVPKSAAIILNNQNGIRQAGGSSGNMYRNSSTNLPRTIKVVAQSPSGRPPAQNGPMYRSIMNEPKPIPLRTMKATAPIPKPSTSQLKNNPSKPRQPAPKPAIKKKPPVKRKRGRKRDNTMQDNFTTEMNELRSKIQSRFDSKRKAAIKKEDVGYEGPYIKSYHLPDTEGQTPVPNFIVDDLEAHVIPTGTNRHRLKLDKPTGMAGTEAVLTCAFCHLDPAAERETGMGDLIGPMLVPAEVRWNRKPGEDKAFVYVHSKCLEWSSNFRMIGFELAEPRALFEDCKNTCEICTRRGATIGCSGPRCTKAFHFPCAQLQGLKMIRDSHQIYCDIHQNAVMRKRKPNQEA